MLCRFPCPNCQKTLLLDMPETTIFQTCTGCRVTLQLRLTPGGDVKAAVVDAQGQPIEKAKK